jgi:hypothetical protein
MQTTYRGTDAEHLLVNIGACLDSIIKRGVLIFVLQKTREPTEGPLKCGALVLHEDIAAMRLRVQGDRVLSVEWVSTPSVSNPSECPLVSVLQRIFTEHYPTWRLQYPVIQPGGSSTLNN